MGSFMYYRAALAAWLCVSFWALTDAQMCAVPYTSYTTVDGITIPSLIDITAEDLAIGLETGLFTSVDLVKVYTARINEVQSTLNTITEINPDAIAIAEELDAERANGTTRGPLHGVPIIIKMNIGTDDKLNTTAGSYALLGAKLPRDSGIASRLRAAGVIILGKSNLSQWANFRSTNSSNGWSAYGGQVYGAYYPSQDPSGSSSGSGVGSSIGLAWAALGTETSGSILSPSSQNNLCGIKPTVGLTSRSLVVPISEHQDTVGPMARTCKDAAYLLYAIAGKDPYDNYTSAIPYDPIPDYVGACNFSSLKGARIGIPRNAIGTSSTYAPMLSAFSAAIEVLEKAGATIVDNANYTAYAQYLADSNSSSIVLDVDFYTDLPENFLSHLTTNPTNITSLADVTAFTHAYPPEDWPDRNTVTWQQALAYGFNNTDLRFWTAYQKTSYYGGAGGVTGALEKFNLDALILPTPFSPGIPALAGLPVVTVPMGFYPANTTVVKSSRGLVEYGPNIPFGLSFLGKAWSEETLISFAYAYEQRTKNRDKVKPYIVPSIELKDVLGE